jgi:hypothetical protein
MPKTQLATVWLFHADGRTRAGHNDAEKAWAEADTLAPRSRERAEAVSRFTPVEIRIAVTDVPRAVDKWEQIAGTKGVCHVEVYDREPGMELNRLYG